MNPRCGIVILNWNDEHTTARALKSLQNADLGDALIIVVDNGSKDGSEARLKARFPEIDLLVLPENRGYAGGCNAGIEHALERECHAIFIMNDDVIVAPDFLPPLLQKCQDPSVGLLGGKIYLPGDPPRFQSCGAFINLLTGETRSRFEEQVDTGQAEYEFEPDYLSGAAILLTRRLIENVGGFDDRLFMYYEETDLCIRAKQAGLKVLYVPKSRVWHNERSVSGSPRRSRRQFYMLRNRIIFMRKYAGYLRLAVFWFYLFGYRIHKEIAISLLGRAGTIGRIFKAVWEGMTFQIQQE